MQFEKIAVIIVCVMLLVIGMGIGEKISRRVLCLKLLALFLCWVFLIIYQSHLTENVLTILTDTHTSKVFSNFTSDELHDGDVITAQFVASDNYLGIIGIRFWNFYRINEDYVTFRIKRHGQSLWLYQHTYKTDQFQPNDYFTFGFPTIPDSAAKTYDLEIQSVGGEPGSAIGLSKLEPVMIAKYKYPKSELLKSRQLALMFMVKKFFNLLSSSDFSVATLLFMFPLLTQVILYHFQNKINSFYRLIKTVVYKLVLFFLTGEKMLLKLSRIITKSELSETDIRLARLETKADLIISQINRSAVILTLLFLGMLINTFWYPKGEITVLLLLGLTMLFSQARIISRAHLTAAAFIMLLLAAFSYYLVGPEISERFSVWIFILWATLAVKSFAHLVTHKS